MTQPDRGRKNHATMKRAITALTAAALLATTACGTSSPAGQPAQSTAATATVQPAQTDQEQKWITRVQADGFLPETGQSWATLYQRAGLFCGSSKQQIATLLSLGLQNSQSATNIKAKGGDIGKAIDEYADATLQYACGK